MDTYVYFIGRETDEGPIKIGYSNAPQVRLAGLMAWSPYPLTVLATIKGDSLLERRFHALFRESHSHHEWFHRTPELLRVIGLVRAGCFDTETLPEARGLTILSEAARHARGQSQRLTWMEKWGYPIPAEIRRAARYHPDPSISEARRAIVREFVAQHYDAAVAQKKAA